MARFMYIIIIIIPWLTPDCFGMIGLRYQRMRMIRNALITNHLHIDMFIKSCPILCIVSKPRMMNKTFCTYIYFFMVWEEITFWLLWAIFTNIFVSACTACPKSYCKSVLHLLKYTANLYLSRCSTYLRKILGHSVYV